MFKINEKKASHKLYHSSLFNHKSPLNSTEEFNYYNRAVNRFLALLNNKSNHILFLCTVIQEFDKRPDWKNGFNGIFQISNKQDFNSFLETIEVIEKINSNVKFIFINQYTERVPNLDVKEMNKNCLWINFHAKGKNNGVKYLSKIDDEIIKNIHRGMNQELNSN